MVFPRRDRPLASGAADRENVIKLLGNEKISLTPEFMRLRKHRLQSRESWSGVLPQRSKSWEKAGFVRLKPPKDVWVVAGGKDRR